MKIIFSPGTFAVVVVVDYQTFVVVCYIEVSFLAVCSLPWNSFVVAAAAVAVVADIHPPGRQTSEGWIVFVKADTKPLWSLQNIGNILADQYNLSLCKEIQDDIV